MRQDYYNNPRNYHVICACSSDEHTLRLIHFKADPEKRDDFLSLVQEALGRYTLRLRPSIQVWQLG